MYISIKSAKKSIFVILMQGFFFKKEELLKTPTILVLQLAKFVSHYGREITIENERVRE